MMEEIEEWKRRQTGDSKREKREVKGRGMI